MVAVSDGIFVFLTFPSISGVVKHLWFLVWFIVKRETKSDRLEDFMV